MLRINIGDTIYLTKEDASITDTVDGYWVGRDEDGNQAVVGVRLKVADNYYRLTKKYSFSDDVWTVDEVNGESPIYSVKEYENNI